MHAAAQQYTVMPTIGSDCYSWIPDICSRFNTERKARKNQKSKKGEMEREGHERENRRQIES